ncbi:MAG: hypothetical protein CME06_00270 [Gemmatimonadetes bacterium]|nr:hypothetical protein [Gemmatimonadota bacterium]
MSPRILAIPTAIYLLFAPGIASHASELSAPREHPEFVLVSFESDAGIVLRGNRFTGSNIPEIEILNDLLESLSLVELRDLISVERRRALRGIVRGANAKFSERSIDLSRHFVIELAGGVDGRDVAALLRAETIVERAEISMAYPPPGACIIPTDPNAVDRISQGQWYLFRTEHDRAWADACGDGVVIADCDAGYQTDHWELDDNFIVSFREDFADLDAPLDVDDGIFRYHGTAVTGIMSAESNGLEIAGGAHESKVIPLQYYNYDGTDDISFEEGVANCVAGAILLDPDIIVLEAQYGGSAERIPGVSDLVAGAVAGGIHVVAAAGNYSTLLDYEQSNFTGSVIVGALDVSDDSAYFTNYGPRVDVAAAGESQYTTTTSSGFTPDFGGTSGATPVVVGAVANIVQLDPTATPEEVRTTLRATSHPLDTYREVGGMVNAHGALHGVVGDRATLSLYPEQLSAAQGSSTTFDVALFNGGVSPVDVEIRVDLYLPNGNPHPGNPFMGPQSTVLPAGMAVNAEISADVPAFAPVGEYRAVAIMDAVLGGEIDRDELAATVF